MIYLVIWFFWILSTAGLIWGFATLLDRGIIHYDVGPINLTATATFVFIVLLIFFLLCAIVASASVGGLNGA
jgi:hypothetical protein